MPRRSILTPRQLAALFGLPEDEQTILHYYTLSDEDIRHIQEKRKPQNRIGFALQLCAFRYPGRFLQPREVIPTRMLSFIGAQLGIDEDALATYGQRQQTKHEHSKQLQAIYGFTPLAGEVRAQMQQWLVEAAENARSNEELARLFLQECRNRQVIVPGETVVERLCGAALVDAEQHITMRICHKLDSGMRERLLSLLGETIDGRLTLFVWLRQFEPGNNSSVANQLLDRLEYLQRLNIPESVVENIPNHRIGRLRRQGERYYADGLRDVHKERRLAILAVCAIEWKAMIADALVETHERIVGKLFNECKRTCETQLQDQKSALQATLKAFAKLGSAIMDARANNTSIEGIIQSGQGGWEGFSDLVTTATGLTSKLAVDPLDFAVNGYHRFRRYMPRFLEILPIHGTPAAASLLKAIEVQKWLNRLDKPPEEMELPIQFARPKWRKVSGYGNRPDRRTWEVALAFTVREAFQSKDIWLAESRRYRDFSSRMMPLAQAASCIASIVTQRVVPSQMLRTLSSFSRQNELAFALREIGRIGRTIFILQWIRNTDLQRRAQIGLNKGEAHHALKRALNFNRNGEIRDRATENQHYRMLGLNLLTAIVIYWNTKHLGKLMKEMEEQGKDVTPELKSHVSPLGWEHIILAEYLWKNP